MIGSISLVIILVCLVPIVLVVLSVMGVSSLIRNHKINSMNPNEVASKGNAQDILLNVGSFIALYTLLASLLNLLFSIIDTVYPRIVYGYNYAGSTSISWPVSILVVFFPIFILMMYFLERQYRTYPERQGSVAHQGFAYITLFLSGAVIAGDLITIIYYFIDGR